MTTARRGLGTAGEGHARRYLEAQGLRFRAANWRFAGGELDLVMDDGDCLVFVEVKIRRGEAMGRAEDGITPAQARRLLRAGARYVADHPDVHERVWRIDLVAITLDPSGAAVRLTHVPNAVGDW